MPKKKQTKTRRKTDLVPESEPKVPLDGEPWIGHDNAKWIDVAVDSRNPNVILWLRKRVKSDQYFLIASCIGAHILKGEVTREAAMELFPSLPVRAPFNVCFPGSKGSKEG